MAKVQREKEMQEVYPIARLAADSISPEEFTAQFVTRCMPVILTGAIDSWPAYGRWTTNFFNENFGELEVAVDWGTDGPGRWRRMPLREYLSIIEAFGVKQQQFENLEAEAAGPVPYLRTWNAADEIKELREDYSPPPHFMDGFKGLSEGSRPPFEWVFIGPPGARTLLHEDIWGTDAWLAQLQGRKHFMLFHPAHRRYLEVDNVFVDPLNPDLSKYPEYNKAKPVEAILAPGEVIYIPRRWPHFVIGLDVTVSVTVNFLSKANHKHVLDSLTKYIERRKICERILGRPLRARDNLMKYCCHGGAMPASIARQMLSLPAIRDQADSEDDDSDINRQAAWGGATTAQTG